ncbi:SMC-Scp complex subunit ScpB [Prosthecochloris sp. CIB 2401]|nr:SMC-Scp complex subunit ScpB [Prosthecochloris sp. CIB 2401]ANT64256.1 Segregation and condensation protein B [Prosthecochloris sp. CIB 2401]
MLFFMNGREPTIEQKVEAVIFASEEAVTARLLLQVLDGGFDAGQLDAIVDKLNAGYEASGRSFRIVRIAEGYRFMTEPSFAPLLSKMVAPRVRRKLSQSVLEVLAVIAYRQPVSRSELLRIRGVSPDYAISRLLERGLIDVRGRARTVGKPLLYGTTVEFLDLFGLHSLQDLPKLREIKELVEDEEVREYLTSVNERSDQDSENKDEQNGTAGGVGTDQ